MTNEELFRALAGVNPVYLEQSEAGSVSRKRPVSRLILIAAVVAALTGTVLAATVARNFLTGLSDRLFNRPGVVEDLRGNTEPVEGLLAIEMAADANPDRPDHIAQSYLPMYFIQHWQTQPLERPGNQNSVHWQSKRPNVTMTWYGPDGQYAIYNQDVIPGYSGVDVWPYDEIPIGYNESVETVQTMVGERAVLYVEVPPSELTVDGTVFTHPGYRRYFWSDGDYVFSLEVSYDVSEDLVEQALGSMAPVENPDKYLDITYTDPPAPSTEPQTPDTEPAAQLPVVFPAWLPDGWEQYLGRIQHNGYCQFEWRYTPADAGVWYCLTLEQARPGAFDRQIAEHETNVRGKEKLELEVGAWSVRLYYDAHIYEAYWTDGENDWNLAFRGFDGMTIEDFIKVLESLDTVEELSGVLTQ